MISSRQVNAWESAQNVIWRPTTVLVSLESNADMFVRLTVFNGLGVARAMFRSGQFTCQSPGQNLVTFAPGLIPGATTNTEEPRVVVSAQLPADLWIQEDERLAVDFDIQSSSGTVSASSVTVTGQFGV